MRERPYLVLFLTPVLAYLTLLLLVAAFVARPSALGWIGFGVAAAVAVLIGTGAAILYPRSRTNAPRLHPHPDGTFRLLVVADAHCEGAELCRAVERSLAGRPAQVLVVAPVLASPLHFLTDAEPDEQDDARARLGEALTGLDRLGIAAQGIPAGDDPLQAIGDALARFPADELLVVAPESGRRSWLEHDLERTIRDAYGVHVSRLMLGPSSVARA